MPSATPPRVRRIRAEQLCAPTRPAQFGPASAPSRRSGGAPTCRVASRRRAPSDQGTIGMPMARTRNKAITITATTIQIRFPHATTTGLASPGASLRDGRRTAPRRAAATSPRPTTSGSGFTAEGEVAHGGEQHAEDEGRVVVNQRSTRTQARSGSADQVRTTFLPYGHRCRRR